MLIARQDFGGSGMLGSKAQSQESREIQKEAR